MNNIWRQGGGAAAYLIEEMGLTGGERIVDSEVCGIEGGVANLARSGGT